MNTIERNRFTEAWHDFGASLDRPAAVLAVSAHWYTEGVAVTAMPAPRTIHDFYGFPRELFEFEYPAPGSAARADRVIELVGGDQVRADHGSWGLDHGTWSVLTHVLPEADVPVVQLSIDASRSFEEHFELATRLAVLRSEGVFVLASGNIVHNLGRLAWESPEMGYDWAEHFDADVRAMLAEDPSRVPELAGHPDLALVAPTSEHLIPLMYLAAMATHGGEIPGVLVQGCAYGSLSMTSFATPGPPADRPGGAGTA